jgi:hypothetical protein
VRRHCLGLLKETAALDRGRQLAVCAISLALARIAAAAKCFIIRVTSARLKLGALRSWGSGCLRD